MAKTHFIASILMAACATVALAQIATDGAGVTVSLNGATVLHRTWLNYPPAALQHGVQGTVTAELKVDATGNVSDAQIISGPDELRRGVLESVLQWHFTRDAANSTRVVQIAFEVPKAGAEISAASAAMLSTATRSIQIAQSVNVNAPVQGRVSSIRAPGLPEQAARELLASLPVHEGDEWNSDAMLKAMQAVKTFDEHLTILTSRIDTGSSGSTSLGLIIMAPGTRFEAANPQSTNQLAAAAAFAGQPERIRVGGNVVGASILRKTAPVYPAAAKAARISGVVHLAVVIGKDGTMQSVNLLDGPPELTDAAMDAVRLWVYRPTLLNGLPVQVETTIDVNFTLNQ